MPLLESFLINIGFALAKHMVSSWLNSSAWSSVSDGILDTAKDRVKTLSSFEKTTIEQIAQQVLSSMQPIFDEALDLKQNDKQAVILAAASTLANSPLSAQRLIDLDLDERKLSAYLQSTHPTANRDLGAGQQLYSHLLDEYSRAILTHVEQLAKDFTWRIEKQHLHDDHKIQSTLELLLEIVRSQQHPPTPPPPLQLPARVKFFKNRRTELTRITQQLTPGAVVEICGPGGMGKTALAAEVLALLTHDGQSLPDSFPDGVIFHSFYNHPEVNLAFEHIARSFGREPKPTPEAAAIEALSGKRAILFLDGAERAQGLDQLLQIRGRCAALVTTRQRGQETDEWQDLDPLEIADALSLLRDLGAQGPEQSLTTICELVGRLPMALLLAGSYLKQSPTPVDEFPGWLAQSPLTSLDHGYRRMQSVNVLLQKSLAEVTEQARQVMGVVGLLALAPFRREWIEAALAVDAPKAGAALAELVRFSLLRFSEGWFQVSHALVHTYAREMLWPPEGSAEHLGGFFTEVVKKEKARGLQGYQILIGIRAQVISLIELLAEKAEWEAAATLAWAIEAYLDSQGSPSEMIRVAQAALTSARASHDLRSEVVWQINLGLAYSALGQVNKVNEYCEQVDALKREIGDRILECNILGNQGSANLNIGQLEQAIEYYNKALEIAREIGDQYWEGNQLGNLGVAYAELGEVEKAIGFYEQALEIIREFGDFKGKGTILGNMGSAFLSIGQVRQAMEYYNKALRIACEIGDRREEGTHACNLGAACVYIGLVERAFEYYEHALTVALEIGDRKGEGITLFNLGLAYQSLNQLDAACASWQQALSIFEEIKSPHVVKARNLLQEYCP